MAAGPQPTRSMTRESPANLNFIARCFRRMPSVAIDAAGPRLKASGPGFGSSTNDAIQHCAGFGLWGCIDYLARRGQEVLDYQVAPSNPRSPSVSLLVKPLMYHFRTITINWTAQRTVGAAARRIACRDE